LPFRIGFMELIIIMALALVVFGPKRLAGLGKTLGDTVRAFTRSSSEYSDKTTVLDEPAENTRKL